MKPTVLLLSVILTATHASSPRAGPMMAGWTVLTSETADAAVPGGRVGIWQLRRATANDEPIKLVLVILPTNRYRAAIQHVNRFGPTASIYATGLCDRGVVVVNGNFFIDTETPDSVFAVWLAELSGKLGEVQFFSNYRVPEFHEWALAVDGTMVRAYGWLGEHFEVTRFIGEPTSIERASGLGTRDLGEESDTWGDEEYEAFSATTPNESDVMKVAGAWSVDPSQILDDDVPGHGILGGFDSTLTAFRR